MAESDKNVNRHFLINQFNQGICKDFSEMFTKEGSYVNALNFIFSTRDGDTGSLVTEKSDLDCDLFNSFSSAEIIGTHSFGENEILVFIKDRTTGNDLIILAERVSAGSYTYFTVFSEPSNGLNFKISAKIKCEHRVNAIGERIVYFNDALNPPRVINIDNPPTHKKHLNLFPEFNPGYTYSTSTTNGFLEIGVYRFAFRFVDNRENRTNAVLIDDVFRIAKASSNSLLAPGLNSGKAIELTYALDETTYESVEFFAIRENTDGSYEAKLVARKTDFSGTVQLNNFESLTEEVDYLELILPTVRYKTVKDFHIYSKELYLANLESYKDEIDLQRYANEIQLDYSFDAVAIGSDYFSNTLVSLYERSYARDEVYAFSIVFVYKDGRESKAYHIPNISGNMPVYTSDNLYPVDFDNNDSLGNPIASISSGQPLRFHRMPAESVAGASLTTGSGANYNYIRVTMSNLNIDFDAYNIQGYKLCRAVRDDNNRQYIAKGYTFKLQKVGKNNGWGLDVSGTDLKSEYALAPNPMINGINGYGSAVSGSAYKPIGAPEAGRARYTLQQNENDNNHFHFFSPDIIVKKPKLIVNQIKLISSKYCNINALLENTFFVLGARFSPDGVFNLCDAASDNLHEGSFSGTNSDVNGAVYVAGNTYSIRSESIGFDFDNTGGQSCVYLRSDALVLSEDQLAWPASTGANASQISIENTSNNVSFAYVNIDATNGNFGRGLMYYTGLKTNQTNQYGELDSINYVSCGYKQASSPFAPVVFKGGDVYINYFYFRKTYSTSNPDLWKVTSDRLWELNTGTAFRTIIESEINYSFVHENGDIDSEKSKINYRLISVLQDEVCKFLGLARGKTSLTHGSSGVLTVEGLYQYLSDSTMLGPVTHKYYIGQHSNKIDHASLYDNALSTNNTIKAYFPEFYYTEDQVFLKNSIAWSLADTNTENDNLRVFQANNITSINSKNAITVLFDFRDVFYIQTSHELYKTFENQQNLQTTGVNVYLGTGDKFAINPKPLTTKDGGHAGCVDIFSGVNTENGRFWIDRLKAKAFLLGEGLEEISNIDVNKDFNRIFLDTFYTTQQYKGYDHIYSVYDDFNKRILFTLPDVNYSMSFSFSNKKFTSYCSRKFVLPVVMGNKTVVCFKEEVEPFGFFSNVYFYELNNGSGSLFLENNGSFSKAQLVFIINEASNVIKVFDSLSISMDDINAISGVEDPEGSIPPYFSGIGYFTHNQTSGLIVSGALQGLYSFDFVEEMYNNNSIRDFKTNKSTKVLSSDLIDYVINSSGIDQSESFPGRIRNNWMGVVLEITSGNPKKIHYTKTAVRGSFR